MDPPTEHHTTNALISTGTTTGVQSRTDGAYAGNVEVLEAVAAYQRLDQ